MNCIHLVTAQDASLSVIVWSVWCIVSVKLTGHCFVVVVSQNPSFVWCFQISNFISPTQSLNCVLQLRSENQGMFDNVAWEMTVYYENWFWWLTNWMFSFWINADVYTARIAASKSETKKCLFGLSSKLFLCTAPIKSLDMPPYWVFLVYLCIYFIFCIVELFKHKSIKNFYELFCNKQKSIKQSQMWFIFHCLNDSFAHYWQHLHQLHVVVTWNIFHLAGVSCLKLIVSWSNQENFKNFESSFKCNCRILHILVIKRCGSQRGTHQERKTERCLCWRGQVNWSLRNYQLMVPQIRANISVCQSLSSRHMPTSTLWRRLHESGFHV